MPKLKLIQVPSCVTCVELFIRKEHHLFIVDAACSKTHISVRLLSSINKINKVKVSGISSINECFLVEQVFNFCGVSVSSFIVDTFLCEKTEYSGLVGQDILRQFSKVIINYVENTISFER